jgi:hypothetical protein
VMPNSAWTTAVISPAERSPSAMSSRMRRRTGSPRMSKACIVSEYTAILILVKPYICPSFRAEPRSGGGE